MSNEIAEIESTFTRHLQVALIAGIRVGQQLAVSLKKRLDAAKTADAHEANRLRAAFDADRNLAWAEISQTRDPKWWEKATPDDIGRVTALTEAWEPHLEGGPAARADLFAQLEERYGIRSYETGTAPELIAAQLRVWEQDRIQEAAATGGELTEQAAAEISASAVAQAEIPRKPVRFEADLLGEHGGTPDPAEIVRRIEAMPPAAELTSEHKQQLSRWAALTPDVDAAIWRNYPDVLAETVNGTGRSEQAAAERGRAAEDLNVAAQQAENADRFAAESHVANNDPERDQYGRGEERLRQADAATHSSEHAYDSAERRAETAAALEAEGADPQTVEAHRISDTAQGKPARDAVRPGRAAKARPSRAQQGPGRGIERSR